MSNDEIKTYMDGMRQRLADMTLEKKQLIKEKWKRNWSAINTPTKKEVEREKNITLFMLKTFAKTDNPEFLTLFKRQKAHVDNLVANHNEVVRVKI